MMQNNSESNQVSIPQEQKCNYHEDEDLLRYTPLQDDDDDLSFQLEINDDPSIKIQPPFRSKPCALNGVADGYNENDDDIKFFFSEPSASETSSINTTPLTPNNYLKYDAVYSPGGGNLSSNSLSPRRKGPLSPRRRVMFTESFKTQLKHESNTPERDEKETTLHEKHDSQQDHLSIPFIHDEDARDSNEKSNRLDPVTDVSSNQDTSIVQNHDQIMPSNMIADSNENTPSSKLTLTNHHRIQSLDAYVSPESALYHSAVETPGSDMSYEKESSAMSYEKEESSADDNTSDDSSVEETPDLSFAKIYDKYLVSSGQSTVNEERQGLLASFDGETIDTTIVRKEDFMIQEEMIEEKVDDLDSPESVKTTPFNYSDHEGKDTETGNNPSVSRNHIKELRIDPIDYVSPTQREPSDAVTPIRSNSSEILKLKLTNKNLETPLLQVNKPVKHDETQDTQENANAASSADDEISVEVPYRKRIQSGEKKFPGHRRTRSGDEAAASLYTGGVDWIGMERTGLPLPAERGIRDDEDDSDENYEPNQATISSYARRNEGSHKRSSYKKITEPISHKGQTRMRKHQLFLKQNQAVLSPKNEAPLSVSNDSHSSSNFSWISNKVSLQSDKGNLIGKKSNEGHHFPSNESEHNDDLLFPSIPFDTTMPTSTSNTDKGPPLSLTKSTKGEDLFELNPKNTNLEWSAHESGSMFETNEANDRMQEENNQTDPSVRRRLSSYGTEYLISNQQSVSGSRKSQKYQTFTCPNCGTSQREFYTIDSAKHRSPSSFLAVYFALYLIAALFIFGMEEGWPPLECIYFSIITLTTTGLGDYVPTSDSAKIVCSIFIYFGVACIGLVWGTLMASSLDDASRKSIRENLISNCETCLQRQSQYLNTQNGMEESAFQTFKRNSQLGTIVESQIESTGSWNNNLQSVSFSPIRQAHTRHLSLDLDDKRNFLASEKLMVDNEIRASSQSPHQPRLQRNFHRPTTSESDVYSFLSEASTASSNLLKPMSSIKAAKFIIITLRQAVANSIFVIAVGSLGFYFIEQLSAVDAFYFTTVLLTTVGYGDIVPTTSAGKLFASLYVLVAGTLLLHNMSMISMIPMELRKRRLEQSVLLQFGDELDDAALRELASGSLVKRLQITDCNRPMRLDECTRETFALAMLVRLGRVSEQDIRLTFAAFQRLDKDNDGVLNSRDIILSEYERKLRNLSRRSSSNSTQPRGGGGGGGSGSVTASIQHQQQHSRHSSYESTGFMEAQSHTRHSSRESVGGIRSEKLHNNMMNVNPSSEFHPLLGGKQNPSNHLMMRNEPSYMSIRNEGPQDHDLLKNRNRSNSGESHISEVTVDVETGDLYNPFFR